MNHICKIYWLDSGRIPQTRLFAGWRTHMQSPPAKTRPQQLLSKILLAYALASPETTPSDLLRNIHYSPFGKPSLPDGPYFSISHSQDLIAIAISDTLDLGMDIQHITGFKKNQSDFFLHQSEQGYLCNCSDESIHPALTAIWTKKEALGKLLGTGIGLGFRTVDTSDGFSARVGDKKYAFAAFATKEHYSGHISFPYGETVTIQTKKITTRDLAVRFKTDAPGLHLINRQLPWKI